MQQITLTRPDDMHLHLRDHDAMASIVCHSAAQFGRAIVMPNLPIPVTTVTTALQYHQRICQRLPKPTRFTPYMTLYLTNTTPIEEIQRIKQTDEVLGVKLYPAGATTNSTAGVTDIIQTYPALETMQTLGIPLLVHGEVTDKTIDVFDREAVFINTVLTPLHQQFPELRIVLEHITTKEAVTFVEASPAHIVATITAHHLLLNRNAIFEGGIRPHHYCLPVLKRETHRQALIAAAISGNPKFFLGTDSAPHSVTNKTNACGCAGIYTAHAAIELYAETFAAHDALAQLEGFASHYGADFYGLSRNTDTITLSQIPWLVENEYPLGEEVVVPFRANETILWHLDTE